MSKNFGWSPAAGLETSSGGGHEKKAQCCKCRLHALEIKSCLRNKTLSSAFCSHLETRETRWRNRGRRWLTRKETLQWLKTSSWEAQSCTGLVDLAICMVYLYDSLQQSSKKTHRSDLSSPVLHLHILVFRVSQIFEIKKVWNLAAAAENSFSHCPSSRCPWFVMLSSWHDTSLMKCFSTLSPFQSRAFFRQQLYHTVSRIGLTPSAECLHKDTARVCTLSSSYRTARRWECHNKDKCDYNVTVLIDESGMTYIFSCNCWSLMSSSVRNLLRVDRGWIASLNWFTSLGPDMNSCQHFNLGLSSSAFHSS